MKLNGGITYLNGQRFRLMIKLSASTGKEYCESTDRCNSKVKLFTSTGRDLDKTPGGGEGYSPIWAI